MWTLIQRLTIEQTDRCVRQLDHVNVDPTSEDWTNRPVCPTVGPCERWSNVRRSNKQTGVSDNRIVWTLILRSTIEHTNQCVRQLDRVNVHPTSNDWTNRPVCPTVGPCERWSNVQRLSTLTGVSDSWTMWTFIQRPMIEQTDRCVQQLDHVNVDPTFDDWTNDRCVRQLNHVNVDPTFDNRTNRPVCPTIESCERWSNVQRLRTLTSVSDSWIVWTFIQRPTIEQTDRCVQQLDRVNVDPTSNDWAHWPVCPTVKPCERSSNVRWLNKQTGVSDSWTVWTLIQRPTIEHTDRCVRQLNHVNVDPTSDDRTNRPVCPTVGPCERWSNVQRLSTLTSVSDSWIVWTFIHRPTIEQTDRCVQQLDRVNVHPPSNDWTNRPACPTVGPCERWSNVRRLNKQTGVSNGWTMWTLIQRPTIEHTDRCVQQLDGSTPTVDPTVGNEVFRSTNRVNNIINTLICAWLADWLTLSTKNGFNSLHNYLTIWDPLYFTGCYFVSTQTSKNWEESRKELIPTHRTFSIVDLTIAQGTTQNRGDTETYQNAETLLIQITQQFKSVPMFTFWDINLCVLICQNVALFIQYCNTLCYVVLCCAVLYICMPIVYIVLYYINYVCMT